MNQQRVAADPSQARLYGPRFLRYGSRIGKNAPSRLGFQLFQVVEQSEKLLFNCNMIIYRMGISGNARRDLTR